MLHASAAAFMEAAAIATSKKPKTFEVFSRRHRSRTTPAVAFFIADQAADALVLKARFSWRRVSRATAQWKIQKIDASL